MHYINPTPNETGNHGNPMGQPFPNCVTLPDDLLSPYLAAKGFVTLTVENGGETQVLEQYLRTGDENWLNHYLKLQGSCADAEAEYWRWLYQDNRQQGDHQFI